MAQKDPEHEEKSESLSATAMFLRAVVSEPQPTPASADSTPPAGNGDEPRTEAGEFTRMFRPISSPEAAAQPPSAMTHPHATTPRNVPSPSSEGEFTRAFVMPASLTENPSASPAVPSKGKGFSTPGISDSASAEGSFTRIFRAPPQQAAPSNLSSPALARFVEPESIIAPPEPSPHQSGVTELFRTLAPATEKTPTESAYRPEPTPNPYTYVEPTRLSPPDRPANALPPGGGVTALLNRLTAETPLMPAEPVSLPTQRPPEPTLGPAVPIDSRGEFTRIIQAAEVQAALSQSKATPPVSTPAPALPSITISAPTPPAPSPITLASPALVAPKPPTLKVDLPPMPPPAKGKLQELVPLLLVANAFLMLILILLVAFALHRK